MLKKDITRRESLKKIAVTAYAAPATVMLLTADRATAQSAQCYLRVINNTSAPITNTLGLDTVPVGQERTYPYTVPPGLSGGTLNAAMSALWDVGPPQNQVLGPTDTVGVSLDTLCWQVTVTVTEANGQVQDAGPSRSTGPFTIG